MTVYKIRKDPGETAEEGDIEKLHLQTKGGFEVDCPFFDDEDDATYCYESSLFRMRVLENGGYLFVVTIDSLHEWTNFTETVNF